MQRSKLWSDMLKSLNSYTTFTHLFFKKIKMMEVIKFKYKHKIRKLENKFNSLANKQKL